MTPSVLRTITIEKLWADNKLLLDYVSNPPGGIENLLQGFSGDLAFWRRLSSEPDRTGKYRKGDKWDRLVDDLQDVSERSGTVSEILEKLERSKREEVLFVIGGQQPGFNGGPICTLYKALTVVSLADRLEQMLSRPFIPLFWVASDDTDFQEIKCFSILGDDLSLLSTSLPAKAHKSGTPVGDIATGPIAETWEHMTHFVDDFPKGRCVRDWVAEAFTSAGDNGEFFMRILAALTDGKLVFADGRSEWIRKFAKPLFCRYLDQEEKVKQAVRDRGTWLEERGYNAQLFPGKDAGIFLLEEGIRRTVPQDKLSQLREAFDRSIERCSPGVILRNLIQDDVFRPLAVVLGPSEIAYRVQMADLYAEFDIPRPAAVPRLTATFIPRKLMSLIEEQKRTRVDVLLRNPSSFADALYIESVPQELKEATARFRNETGKEIDTFLDAAGKAISTKLQKRLSGQITDLKKRFDRIYEIEREAGKSVALERYPFLVNIDAVIKPQGKPQERVLSCLTPFLFAGSKALGVLSEASERYIDELMDGTLNHIVYSD